MGTAIVFDGKGTYATLGMAYAISIDSFNTIQKHREEKSMWKSEKTQ